MSSPAEICTWSGAKIARAVGAGEVSRREVVEAQVERIARVNPDVNAIVQLRAEQALAEARAADEERGRRQEGVLDGVPITIKEHYDVAGMVQSEGCAALAERRSASDCVAVSRLRAAGAIVVGKSNQPDFAMRWNTVSGLYGTTVNPRDHGLSAGGSSGGDAAAVASGIAPLGLGSDLGGSIRVPAAFCGIYGLRTTPGRVPGTAVVEPRDGTPVRDQMSAVGPLARSVEDLALSLSALAGADPSDPSTPPVPPPEAGGEGKPLRVARMVGETGAVVAPAIEAQVDRVARALSDAGYEVVEAAIPSAAQTPDLWGRIVGTELRTSVLPVIGDQMEETCRAHIEALVGLFEIGDRVEPYLEAWVQRRRIARETAVWMEDCQLVLTPIAGIAPPPLDFDRLIDDRDTATLFDAMRNVFWVPLLGLPAVALPNGVQIVARAYREGDALAAARAVEGNLDAVAIAGGNGSASPAG